MDTVTEKSGRKTYWLPLAIPGFLIVIVLLCMILPPIILTTDISKDVRMTIKKNGHTYTLEEVSGGATIGYYAVLKIDKKKVYQQRAIPPLDVEDVIIKNDSISIVFCGSYNAPIHYQLIE